VTYRVVFPFTDLDAALHFLSEQRQRGWAGVLLDEEDVEMIRLVQPDPGFSVKVNPFTEQSERAS